jgi:predicted alpha/beta-fold hydrolase
MPVIRSAFRPPLILSNGHVQTIVGALLPRPLAVKFSRERLELRDGDFLDLDWAASGRSSVAVLSHGLEGSTRGGYIRGIAAALNAAGWDAIAWNFRGCGEESNRLARSYHSGETGDLGAVIQHAALRYGRIVPIGFSLGGNVTLKYLGEAPPHPSVVGAVAVSAPVDLESSARKLDRRLDNRVYLHRFMKTLIARIEAKALRFPDRIDLAGIRRIRTFEEFDNRYTGPLHGFRDAEDYWRQSSARQYLRSIRVPSLLLNARNDPFLSPECFPSAEAEANPYLTLEAPQSGGHVGFIDLKKGVQPWSERRIVQFLAGIQS